MGNAESSQQASSNAQQEVKTCYYELLGVERDVTEEELKRAYKKKALQLHPDRNFQNEEWATKVFAEVQAAYEVLSDPQERAWYDSHRDSILRGASKEDISQGTGDYSSEHSIHTDTVISFMGKISQNKDFTDSENGFYTTVRNLFNVVADEEIRAASNEGIEIPEPPSFGNSSTPYQPDVKNFYQYWLGFATVKSFAWCDRYRLSDAPDRRIRRLMEKDNNKLREAGRSTFNADVREFVRFVRRRDPRYAPNNVPQQSEAERQAFLQAQSKAQSARDRAANAEKLKQHKNADWMEAELEIHEEFLSEEEESEVEEDEPEIFECILCDKTFKSEAQLKAHEKTKKHVKQVQFIQRKMRKENKELHLDEEEGPSKMTAVDDDYLPDQKEHANETSEKESESNSAKKGQTEEKEVQSGDDDIVEDEQEKSSKSQDTKEPPSKLEESPSEEGDEDEENSDPDHAPISAFHERLNALSLDDRESSTPAPSTPPEPKLGKAKAKRLKKAQKASEGSQSGADGASGEHVCAGCSAGFPSKTKLFQHLKENPKHAKLVPVQGGGKKKKGKK